MTAPISEMPLVQYEENNEEDLVLSNAFKKVFPENSETQEKIL